MLEFHGMGNLTRDPEMRTLNGDKKVVSFGVASNRTVAGNKKTTFIDCEAWEKTAELIATHFKKGDPILVHGTIEQDEWTDKTSGDKKTKMKFRVSRFDFIPNKPVRDNVATQANRAADDEPEPLPGSRPRPANSKKTPVPAGDFGEDDGSDIPF